MRGALLGLAAGCVLALFTRNGSSIDLGIIVGVSLELFKAWIRGDLTEEGHNRRHRTPRAHRSKDLPVQPLGIQQMRAERQEDEVHERELQLRAAAERHVGELLSGIDRTAVLEALRVSAPGFTAARYEAALDEELAGRERISERALARRRELVEQARGMDVLNAVFALSLFNRPHAGLGPVDLHDTLGDLHDATRIDEAIERADALIAHAADLGFGAQDARDDRKELQLAHPGFSLKHLSDALNWGYYNGR